jgi:hypothetical protein
MAVLVQTAVMSFERVRSWAVWVFVPLPSSSKVQGLLGVIFMSVSLSFDISSAVSYEAHGYLIEKRWAFQKNLMAPTVAPNSVVRQILRGELVTMMDLPLFLL